MELQYILMVKIKNKVININGEDNNIYTYAWCDLEDLEEERFKQISMVDW